jgi:hypothetical protein
VHVHLSDPVLLERNNISAIGAGDLAKAIVHNQRLQVLDLSERIVTNFMNMSAAHFYT